LLGIGSLLLFLRTKSRYRFAMAGLSGASFLLVAAGDNRAPLVAIGFAGLLLLLARRWQYPALQGVVAATSLLAVVTLANVFSNAWAERKLDGVNDRLASLVDFSGTGRYTSEQSFNKGENNRFRLVWWQIVVKETWTTNPVFGLGFGTDIARSFVGEYFPDGGEDFLARSPHNVFVTAFGRMGLAGVAVWLIFCGILVQQTWRAVRHTEQPENWALWCSACVILVSASFGVVLESPMGAVLFWTLVGLGHGAVVPRDAAPSDRGQVTSDKKDDPALRGSKVGGALRPDKALDAGEVGA
jgi:O-antigen ligase